MIGNFNACLGFTLDPQQDGQPYHVTRGDPGGATSYGVTRATWSRWIGRPASDDDMRAVAVADVAPLYRRWYYDTVAGDTLPAGVDLMVFDFAVNAGEVTSAKALQDALCVDADGHIGPITLQAVHSTRPGLLVSHLQLAQTTYYRHCRDFSLFGDGWLNRTRRRTAAAHAMVAGAAAAPEPAA